MVQLTLFCVSFVEPKLSAEWKICWCDMVEVVERGLCPSGRMSRLEKYLLLLLSWKKLRKGGKGKRLYSKRSKVPLIRVNVYGSSLISAIRATVFRRLKTWICHIENIRVGVTIDERQWVSYFQCRIFTRIMGQMDLSRWYQRWERPKQIQTSPIRRAAWASKMCHIPWGENTTLTWHGWLSSITVCES